MLYHSNTGLRFFLSLFWIQKPETKLKRIPIQTGIHVCVWDLHYSFSNNGKILVIYNNGKFLILLLYHIYKHTFCFLSFAPRYEPSNIIIFCLLLVQFNFKFIKVQYSSVWFGLVWFDSIWRFVSFFSAFFWVFWFNLVPFHIRMNEWMNPTTGRIENSFFLSLDRWTMNQKQKRKKRIQLCM